MAVTLSRRRIVRSAQGPRRRRPPLMEKFVIEGGEALSGTLVPAGNKNGALAILAACVLSGEETILRNVPRIRDIDAMLATLDAIGARSEWRGPNELAVSGAGVHQVEIDRELAERLRASFLLA